MIDRVEIEQLIKTAENEGVQKHVVGAVVLQHNRVLLLERYADDFMGGLVELPSGTVDVNEDILGALIREVKEETGLNVISLDAFVGTFDYTSGSGRLTRQFNFLLTTDGELNLDGHEHSRHYWLDPMGSDIEQYNISAEVKKIIQRVI